MNRKQTTAVTAGFFGGLVLGAVVWSAQIGRSRRELFSSSPVRRMAALGYLAGQPGLDTARILAEYVGWERHPALRRRAQRLLRRMHTTLD
ncbi:MAG TPA: hypothetical protein VHB25_14340 [Gemmatimonadaceae bacterium]|nr:hypothetical protein [Gemmatimonadaceae bacterium]